MSRASADSLDKLHATLAEKLAKRIESGDVTAAEMNVARQFLKDNGIEAAPVPGSPIRNLADSLPFPDQPTH